ncbi:MAG: GNAT family N-acetyltransferase [Erysipelotrichaceae bacterium]|nr:GNAT family N-acetyltransferase [Erysipelotrichaceae bacterium]
MIEIKNVEISDARELLDIYAPYVEKTAISFEYDVPSLEDFENRIRDITLKYPYIKAVEDGKILGYAYASTFKSRRAYDISVETSIYIDEDYRGKGIGKLLYKELERRLKDTGVSNIYACIAYIENEDEYLSNDSMRFHEHLGFRLCGTFHKCAIKFDRYYDMIWMEKII